MRRLVPLLALAFLAPLAPAGGASVPCEPEAFPEGASLDGIGLRASAGPETLYLVTRGARTIGQSDVELWEESNGLAGLQTWEGECGRASDRFLAGACAFRSGALGELQCPRVRTGDLGAFAADHADALVP